MFQTIKSPPPHGKKLFEWDAEKQMLVLVRDKKMFLCELGEDNDFSCVGVSDKPPNIKLNIEEFT